MKHINFTIFLILLSVGAFAQNDDLEATCPNVMDLYSSRVTCTYGYYDNPDQYNGIVDYGQYSVLSRHTIITDPNAYDPYTGNQLKMVPLGESASIRLGNSETDAEAESITFRYHVDTTVSDMLILKYAAVLEDPDHTILNQPKFTFRVLDSQNHDIDATCYSAEFIANPNLGWQTYSSYGYSRILWKDWTTVGVKLNAVHGQTISIKLTTYDCDWGAHFGYAYFTLGCALLNIEPNYCGAAATYSYTAPEGFNYAWFPSSHPETVLSTTRNFSTTTPGRYTCRMGFIGAPVGTSCSTEVEVFATERYPYALSVFDTLDTVDCSVALRLRDSSIVRLEYNDSTYLTSQSCDDGEWIVDDSIHLGFGDTTFTFGMGDHKIALVASLRGGQCTDTVTRWFHVDDFCHCYDTVFDTIVENQLPWSRFGETFSDTTATTIIIPAQHPKCDSVIDYHLFVYSNLFDTTIHYVCDNQLPVTIDSVTFNGEGIHNSLLQGCHGEDSTVTIYLFVVPSTDTTIYDTIVDIQFPWFFFDTIFSDSVADHIFHTYNEAGCDSTIHYNLYVYWNGDHCDTTLSYPNVITPNGDGINDSFVIEGLIENNCFKYNELIIFNRDGRKVYHVRNIHNESDWWSPATNMPEGTYFYIFTAHGINIHTKHNGIIELLR